MNEKKLTTFAGILKAKITYAVSYDCSVSVTNNTTETFLIMFVANMTCLEFAAHIIYL